MNTDYNELLKQMENSNSQVESINNSKINNTITENFTNESVDINDLNKQVNEYISKNNILSDRNNLTVEQPVSQCNPANNCDWNRPDPRSKQNFSIKQEEFLVTTPSSKSFEDKFADFLKDYTGETIKSITLAVTFVAALAWNDTIKFFIGRSIKMNTGSPLYYIYYALLMTLLAVLVNKYI